MAGFIMAGRIQATIFVIVSALVSLLFPPVVVFSNAAIALITLRKGWQQGVIYSLLATASLMIVSGLFQQNVSGGFIAGLVTWFPILVVASILAITKSWSTTLQLILLITVVAVLLFHFLHPDVASFWIQLLEPIKPLLEQSYQLDGAKFDETINNAAQWMTGTFAAAYALLVIVSLIIARSWQARLYNPGGFAEEFQQIRLGKQISIGLLVGVAIAFFTGNQLIIELIMVAIAIFMFQGLSLVHALVKLSGLGTGWLIVMYIFLFILMIQMMVLLAAFGFIDNFIDFRQKVKQRK